MREDERNKAEEEKKKAEEEKKKADAAKKKKADMVTGDLVNMVQTMGAQQKADGSLKKNKKEQTSDGWEMSYPFSISSPDYGFSPQPLNFQDAPPRIKSTPEPSCSSSLPHQPL